MNEEDIRRTLAELGREPLPESALTAVRNRVLGEIAESRRPMLWLRWALIAAALLIVSLVAGVVRYERSLRFEPLALTQPPAPPPVEVQVAKPRPAPRIVARRAQPRPKPAPTAGEEQQQQLVVKLLTPDPDVVIYWVMNTGGSE